MKLEKSCRRKKYDDDDEDYNKNRWIGVHRGKIIVVLLLSVFPNVILWDKVL